MLRTRSLPGPPWPREAETRVWWLATLALGLVAVNGFLRLHGDAAEEAAYAAVASLSTLAIVLGARRLRPPARTPWYLLAAGAAIELAAHVLYVARYESVVRASPVDLLHVAAYGCFAAGFVAFVRRRAPEHDWQTLVDAAIVGVGVGLGSWLLWAPSGGHRDALTTLAVFSYPALDALLAAVCVRLAFEFGVLNPAAWLGLGCLALLWITSGAFTSSQLGGGYETGGLIDAGFLAAYVLGAAAALHPGAAALSVRTAPLRERELVRLALVSAAALFVPLLLVVRGEAFGLERVRVIAAAAALLTGLALLRVGLAALSQARETTRELALRRSATGLLSALDEHAIAEVALAAVTFWAPGATDARLYLRQHSRLEPVASRARAPLPLPAAEILDVAGVLHLSPVPEEIRTELELDPAGTEVLLLPVPLGGRLVGALLVATRHELSWEARAGLRMVCIQTARALAGAMSSTRLELQSLRSSFLDLVESSEDVLLVVDAERRILYNSPSTLDPLGYEAAALAGVRLSELVHHEDATALSRLLADGEAAEAIRLRHLDGSWRSCLCLGAVPVEAPELDGRVLVARVAPLPEPAA